MNRLPYRRANRRRHAATKRQLPQVPLPVVESCAGCLAPIYKGRPLFRTERGVYCSSDCLVKGRHWIDPNLCRGCNGAHPIGVRP